MAEPPAKRSEQRASDSDRDVAAGDLREAFSEGRLGPDEYQRRLDAVWQARTYGELDLLTVDLPQPARRQEKAAAQAKRESRFRAWVGEWRTWLVGAVVMIGIWAVTSLASGEFNDFWPGIPLGIWAVVLIASTFGNGE